MMKNQILQSVVKNQAKAKKVFIGLLLVAGFVFGLWSCYLLTPTENLQRLNQLRLHS
ncbi:MAG: hypothetical protein AB7F43_08155 [Bacteriovoracia bacterium]